MRYSLLIFDWEGTLGDSFSSVKPKLLPGVKEVIPQLQQQGYQLAVATNRGRQGLDQVLQQTDLAQYFVCSRTTTEAAVKPDPDMLEQILWQCDCDNRQALMIGDSDNDQLMAQTAGVDFIFVGRKVGLKSVADLPQWLLDQQS